MSMESHTTTVSGLSSTVSEKRLANQPMLFESIERVQKYERKGKQWKELTDAVLHYLAKDCHALCTIEKPGFKKLIEAFDNLFEIPGRAYFSRTALPALDAHVRHNVKTELVSVNHCTATSDLWSSDGTLIPYISYTVHFLSEDRQLHNQCLQTKFLPQDHTGEAIADSMEETLSMWDLKAETQVCITTDSSSNVLNATKRLN